MIALAVVVQNYICLEESEHKVWCEQTKEKLLDFPN